MPFDYNPPLFTDFDWRDHYQEFYPGTGKGYAEVEPAYQYGYNLATNEAYHDREWNDDFEEEIRAHWERENEEEWENVKHFVRHAWDEVRSVFK